jgi:hypothetical protein
MMLEVAYMLISVPSKIKIGCFVEVMMMTSDDDGSRDLEEVLDAGNGATFGLPDGASSVDEDEEPATITEPASRVWH